MKTAGPDPCVRHPVTVTSEAAVVGLVVCGALVWAAMRAEAANTLVSTPITCRFMTNSLGCDPVGPAGKYTKAVPEGRSAKVLESWAHDGQGRQSGCARTTRTRNRRGAVTAGGRA